MEAVEKGNGGYQESKDSFTGASSGGGDYFPVDGGWNDLVDVGFKTGRFFNFIGTRGD